MTDCGGVGTGGIAGMMFGLINPLLNHAKDYLQGSKVDSKSA
jgi:hypothetical protein